MGPFIPGDSFSNFQISFHIFYREPAISGNLLFEVLKMCPCLSGFVPPYVLLHCDVGKNSGQISRSNSLVGSPYYDRQHLCFVVHPL